MISPPDNHTILQQTVLISRLNPKTIETIAREAHVNRDFATNWQSGGKGAQLRKVEAVLHTCGYRLVIIPLKHGKVK